MKLEKLTHCMPTHLNYALTRRLSVAVRLIAEVKWAAVSIGLKVVHEDRTL